MTYNQLFKLEDFLASNLCTYTHLNIEKEFGKTYTPNMDEVKVKGLYIIIFPEDDDDARAIRKGLETIFSLDENKANWYVYRDMFTFDFRIAIEVERYK